MKRKSLIYILALNLFVAGSTANDNIPEKYSTAVNEISQWLNSQISDGNYVGVSIGFVEGDYMWTEGFGMADIERQVPMTSESVHRMASISKSMTAVGIILLVQEGKIDLDAEVQTYVPAFPKKKWPITVRQLLGHLSGISHYKNYSVESNHTNRFTTKEALELFQDWDLRHEPGAKFSYTTYGYNLLGAVIEGVTGQSYREYMTQNVWQPLGMTSTRTDDVRDIIPNRVAPYTDKDGAFYNSLPVSTSMKLAGGGTVSTVGDMLRFAKGLMDGELVKSHWIDSMWTPMTTNSAHLTKYGMGWRISPDSRRFEVYHGGSQHGTRTFLWMIPSRKLAIVVLCNYDNGDRFTPAKLLLEDIIKRPFVLPPVYSSQPEIGIRLTQLSNAVNAGCGYYDRYRKPYTTDMTKVAAGFSYLSEALTYSDRENIEDRMDKGLWPITDQIILSAMSYMADVLTRKHGENYLWQYHRAGIIQICKDYIDYYNGNKNANHDLRFSEATEQLINDAHRGWIAAWTAEVENLNLEYTEITSESEQILRAAFSGCEICPDLGPTIMKRAKKQIRENNPDQAILLATLAVDMYPNSARTNTQLGFVKLAAGYPDEGIDLIRTAQARWPGAVRHSTLNTVAYEFAEQGQPELGKQILGVAIELFPEVANLYDSKAEMHMMMGDTIAAIELYRKAIEIDPDSQNAKNMLKKITSTD